MRSPCRTYHRFHRIVVLVVCLLSGLALPGCPSAGFPDDDLPDGNKGSQVQPTGEPNDTFDQAIAVILDDRGEAALQGSVFATGDIDVFLLGAMGAGDRLRIDATTPRSSLDVSIAVFDGEQRLVFENDDRDDGNGLELDSSIDWTVRHDSDAYYLAVTHSAFSASGTFTGNYEVALRITSGSAVPEPRAQTLVLWFAGGDIDSPILGEMSIGVFDAADISDTYRGQTDVVKQHIVATFEQNFERFNVVVLTSDDALPADEDTYSIVYLGGFSHDSFGLAEAVDLYNADICDDAIIFTESFSPDEFSRDPSAIEMGVAIGNIAAHEAGHLLGLNHVDDDLALMDDVSSADAFLLDQEFKLAPLSEDIMPLGVQDASLLLLETVGPPEEGANE